MGGTVALLRGLDTVAGIHQLAFVDLDVEATTGGVGAGLDADGDAVHGTGDVGGGEVVGNGGSAEVAVTGAPLTGLAVLS